ncbi:3-alpha,7-alpha,12-alpha-trihydroxy-5-beta-cholest-24-enoyl-CoA hydratase [Burkholderia sp. Bp9143]|uniref:MaoC/PaaZ C-terminal domain-containing protein n=1 Tax=Burkholderia sp. Bp9143 TaxID=2184574 RepID=UPI000F598EA9|nr:MaoC/PaaZ C-terminal domain-containing protein [Burkholderia sp. Bp9143]RQR22035.1 3-alpha,7-alpha,12-alpha-trihydroxy-5-beta-cholest-24-enoyl-CoA hydratase [Burkholderia sp. Bp9143]
MNLEKVLSKQFPALEHQLTPLDCMLYALGVGIGDRPQADDDLQFVYEDGLKVFPSMVNVISHPGPWITEPELGIDWVKILHGEQSFALHASLVPGRTYIGSYRVADVIDKGVGKGAMLYLEKTLRDGTSNEIVSTVTSTYILRGDGGCGGTRDVPPPLHTVPDRPADCTVSLPVLPQAGLIYRLSGDHNPIHASPAIARQAGFEQPILHGLCTMGVATRAIIQGGCNDDPERLRSVKLRFSAPVYPGETLLTELWRECNGVSFRTTAVERNVTVLNNGYAEIDPD